MTTLDEAIPPKKPRRPARRRLAGHDEIKQTPQEEQLTEALHQAGIPYISPPQHHRDDPQGQARGRGYYYQARDLSWQYLGISVRRAKATISLAHPLPHSRTALEALRKP